MVGGSKARPNEIHKFLFSVCYGRRERWLRQTLPGCILNEKGRVIVLLDQVLCPALGVDSDVADAVACTMATRERRLLNGDYEETAANRSSSLRHDFVEGRHGTADR